jgi:hypothetical protein
MPASLRKFPQDRRINLNTERVIHCPYCPHRYLLTWDDKEWNCVKDWIRVAERGLRRSHPGHGDIELPPTLKVPPRA